MSKSLKERRAKAEAELAAIQQEEEELARYKDLLIAQIVTKHMEKDPQIHHQITSLLDAGLKKQRDRQLFELPNKSAQKKAAVDSELSASGLSFFRQSTVS